MIGYILTGGKNKRMNGQIKFFLELKGQSFGEHIIGALSSMDEIFLSVNDPAPYENLGLPMICDEFDSIGPLGGIVSGMHKLKDETLFVVSSDTPFLTEESIRAICDSYMDDPILTLASTGKKLHPLIGIYPSYLLPLLEAMIERGDFKMRNILKETAYHAIKIEDKTVCMNINTPEEYNMLY